MDDYFQDVRDAIRREYGRFRSKRTAKLIKSRAQFTRRTSFGQSVISVREKFSMKQSQNGIGNDKLGRTNPSEHVNSSPFGSVKSEKTIVEDEEEVQNEEEELDSIKFLQSPSCTVVDNNSATVSVHYSGPATIFSPSYDPEKQMEMSSIPISQLASARQNINNAKRILSLNPVQHLNVQVLLLTPEEAQSPNETVTNGRKRRREGISTILSNFPQNKPIKAILESPEQEDEQGLPVGDS